MKNSSNTARRACPPRSCWRFCCGSAARTGRRSTWDANCCDDTTIPSRSWKKRASRSCARSTVSAPPKPRASRPRWRSPSGTRKRKCRAAQPTGPAPTCTTTIAGSSATSKPRNSTCCCSTPRTRSSKTCASHRVRSPRRSCTHARCSITSSGSRPRPPSWCTTIPAATRRPARKTSTSPAASERPAK